MSLATPSADNDGDKTHVDSNGLRLTGTPQWQSTSEELPVKLPDKLINGHTSLNVPLSIDRRPSSPDTLSNISVDERASLRLEINTALPNSDAETKWTESSIWRIKLVRLWQRNLGVALVLLSQVFGTGMSAITRLLERDGGHGEGMGMHPFQVLFARMSITVTLSMLYMWYKRTPHFPFGAPEVRPLLVIRGVGGFFGVFGLYYSLRYLPLSDATVLTFLAPSLACWACSFLLKEPFTRAEQIATAISLLGVVLIARPTSFFGSQTNSPTPPATGNTDISPSAINITQPTSTPTSSTDSDSTATPEERLFAVGIAMLGVLGAATAYTTIRWIGKRAHPLISVNYFATWCTIVSTVMMLSVPSIGFLLPRDLYEWTLLISLGVCGFVMQFLLAAGLQQEKSSRATNMVYSQMLFALAADKVVWGHTPGWLEALGSGLILGSAIFVAVRRESAVKKESGGSGGEGTRDEERRLVGAMDGRGVNGEDEDVDERAVVEMRRLTR